MYITIDYLLLHVDSKSLDHTFDGESNIVCGNIACGDGVCGDGICGDGICVDVGCEDNACGENACGDGVDLSVNEEGDDDDEDRINTGEKEVSPAVLVFFLSDL